MKNLCLCSLIMSVLLPMSLGASKKSLQATQATPIESLADLEAGYGSMHPDSHAVLAQKIKAAGFDCPCEAIIESLDHFIRNDPEGYKCLKRSVDQTRKPKKKKTQSDASTQAQPSATSAAITEQKTESDDDEEIAGDAQHILKFATHTLNDQIEGNKVRARRDCKKLCGSIALTVLSLGTNVALAWINSKK